MSTKLKMQQHTWCDFEFANMSIVFLFKNTVFENCGDKSRSYIVKWTYGSYDLPAEDEEILQQNQSINQLTS